MNIESILPFIREVDRLKNVNRQTLIHSGGRKENSAEHSWHLALTVLLLEKLAPEKIDIAKAIKMALLHDIVEIDAGDTFVYSEDTDKESKELLALKRLTQLLPNELAQEFSALWLEFEAGDTPESKFVNAIDRFLPLYSNFLNDGHSWLAHGISSKRVISKNQKPISEGLPSLWPVADKMIKESVRNHHLEEN